MNEPPPQRKVSGWVKGFVLFHLLAVVVWTMPNTPEGVARGRVKPTLMESFFKWNDENMKTSIIRPYLLVTGGWQYWDMFAPNPAATDYWGDALVTYDDGTQEAFALPRMKNLNIAWKIPRERFRKFHERVHLEASSRLWRDFARGVAIQVVDETKRRPVVVVLRRHWLKIEPPGVAQPSEYNQYPYYTYNVEPDWLRQHGRLK